MPEGGETDDPILGIVTGTPEPGMLSLGGSQYGLDNDGVVRRADSKQIGLHEPDIERTVGRDASVEMGLKYIMDRAADEAALAINNQPVDKEEIDSLFRLLQRAAKAEPLDEDEFEL